VTASAFLDTFLGEQVSWREGRPVWLSQRRMRYRSARIIEVFGRPCEVYIPREFYTDHATVPRMPIIWLAVGGRGIRSATVHDFPYQFGFWWLLVDGNLVRWDVEKPLVDEVFHESLLADPISGVNKFRAWEMYQGVKWGGKGWWADQERAKALNPIWSAGDWAETA